MSIFKKRGADLLKLMYITNNEKVAEIAEKYGVDRIWIDLETLGKEERQPGNTVKSHHSVDDIRKIKTVLTTSELLVRVNPWNDNSIDEIDNVVKAGADIIMLPMWKSAQEVKNFLKAVNHRCKTTLLLETIEAEECLDEVLEMGGFDEIHIGLNDLHLAYGQTFMFELLANGEVDKIINKVKHYNIPYGFGGVGRIGDGMLKADNIIMEHYRLGSTRVILSRTFCNTELITNLEDIEKTFKENIGNLREFERKILETATIEDFVNNHLETINSVKKVVDAIIANRG